jgi:SAM-dependent methyltransferase
MSQESNRDEKTIKNFGDEWERFNYLNRHDLEQANDRQFALYLAPLPSGVLNSNSTKALDVGAGSGRWAQLLESKVKELYVLEPSQMAFHVLENRFKNNAKVQMINKGIENLTEFDNFFDFAMSLGVLHHIPDTGKALENVFKKIKPGGYFLGYLYYNLEEKSLLYRSIWRISNLLRFTISKSPRLFRTTACDFLAGLIYYPLARLSKIVALFHISNASIPLHHYADLPFYMMRNDSLDRFGTPLEQRFSKSQITTMLLDAGATESSINFSEYEPFWTFSAQKG